MFSSGSEVWPVTFNVNVCGGIYKKCSDWVSHNLKSNPLCCSVLATWGRFYQPSRRRQSHLRHENLGVLLPDLWAPVGAINIILTLTTAIRNTIAIIIMSKLYHSRSIPHLSKIWEIFLTQVIRKRGSISITTNGIWIQFEEASVW